MCCLLFSFIFPFHSNSSSSFENLHCGNIESGLVIHQHMALASHPIASISNIEANFFFKKKSLLFKNICADEYLAELTKGTTAIAASPIAETNCIKTLNPRTKEKNRPTQNSKFNFECIQCDVTSRRGGSVCLTLYFLCSSVYFTHTHIFFYSIFVGSCSLCFA